MRRLRALPLLLAFALVAVTAACVAPPPPPAGPVEYLDQLYSYDPAATCRDADAAVPYVGPASCGAVTSTDDAAQAALLAQADDAWTAGQHAEAKALARTAGHRPSAVDIYRPSGATGQRPVVIYLHAGAMVKGDKSYADDSGSGGNRFDGFGPDLAKRGFIVLSIDYELSTLSNIFTLVEAFDGDPGEPTGCSQLADPHPGSTDAFTPLDCYKVALESLEVPCTTDCTAPQTAIRVINRGSVDAYVSAENAIRWAKENATGLGIDPTRVFVTGEAAGSVIAAAVTHQVWRSSTSPEATGTRVVAGTGAVGYSLVDSSVYAMIADSFDNPAFPDVGLGTWPDSGAVEASDPPFRAFMSESDSLYGTAKPIAALSVAKQAGANDGIFWNCGTRHVVEGSARPLMLREIGRFFRSSMGLPTASGLPPNIAALPSSAAGFWPIDTARTPVLGDFDGSGSTDVYFYGQGDQCDSLWNAQPGASGAVEFVPAPLDLVQRGGSYHPVAIDVNGDGRSDIVFLSGHPGDEPVWLDPP